MKEAGLGSQTEMAHVTGVTQSGASFYTYDSVTHMPIRESRQWWVEAMYISLNTTEETTYRIYVNFNLF